MNFNKKFNGGGFSFPVAYSKHQFRMFGRLIMNCIFILIKQCVPYTIDN